MVLFNKRGKAFGFVTKDKKAKKLLKISKEIAEKVKSAKITYGFSLEEIQKSGKNDGGA